MANQLSPLEALSYVQQQGEIGRERGQRNQLAQLYSQTYTAPAEQQNALLGQMAAISPQAAQATQQQFQGQEDRRNRTLANMANLLVNSPAQARPALYQKMLPSLQQFGVQAPEAYDESTAPLIDQTAQALYRAFNGGDANAMAPRVVGNALVDARGKVLYEAPQKQDYQWSERAGAWIPKPGQVPQAAPAAATPYTLGADLTPEQREAAIADAQNNGAADQYTLPQRPAGGLAAIPVAGIEPKPDITPYQQAQLGMDAQRLDIQRQAAEDARTAREEAAGTRRMMSEQKARQAQQAIDTRQAALNNVNRGIERVRKALKAVDDSMLGSGPVSQYATRYSQAGQELESAVGAMQNSMLALTRVPGVGSQSDLEARIANLIYPSLDRDSQVNQNTLKNLEQLARDLGGAARQADEEDRRQSQASSSPAASPSGGVDDLLSKYGVR